MNTNKSFIRIHDDRKIAILCLGSVNSVFDI
jgi:hypothetical protein